MKKNSLTILATGLFMVGMVGVANAANPGDYNGNGIVDPADAMFARQMAGGLRTVDLILDVSPNRLEEGCWFVEGDEEVNVEDAVFLQNRSAYIEPTCIESKLVALIPEGCFDMGDHFDDDDSFEKVDEDLPVHEVCLSAFLMNKHEVTNAEYSECVAAGACQDRPDSTTGSATRDEYYGNSLYDDFPVLYVTWDQASAYCEWAGMRLPTEAEWEYAARGGLAGKRYPWGDEDPLPAADYANYNNIIGDTSPVESYPPNGYGLYDMAGNVWEWVKDDYHGSYDCYNNPDKYNCENAGLAPTDGSAWLDAPPRGAEHSLRGGGAWWRPFADLRVADRGGRELPPLGEEDKGDNDIGIRCAKDAP